MIYEQGTLTRARRIGHITDFMYGQRVAASLFPYKEGWSHTSQGGPWNAANENMEVLLEMKQKNIEKCNSNMCESPVPQESALLFLDNHDTSRMRWKRSENGGIYPDNGDCYWDNKDIGNCRPIYKHGQMYGLAMQYMLAFPYGGSARITSSYNWDRFEDPPPGVRKWSKRDQPSDIHDAVKGPQCR